MQNLLVINQPNRINAIKRFAQSRGLQRYSIIKDSDQLMRALLVETSNVYVFDYFLDMPLVNTLADMRDSVNILMVFVPEARIGNIYLNLTDKIHVMPDEVALLQWMWDTQVTSLQNVLACRAAGTPFCMVSMPDANIRPDKIQVNVSPKQIKATYSMTSGAVVSSKVSQLQVGIRFKGKPILQDEYDVRNQVGIFSGARALVDMPECDLASDDYVAQEVSNVPIKTGFTFPFAFSLPAPKPKKEKAPKPKKEKVKKEKKPKKEKPVKPPKETLPTAPVEEQPWAAATPETNVAAAQVQAAPEWTSVEEPVTPVEPIPAPTFSHDEEHKGHKFPWGGTKKPKQTAQEDEEPQGVLDVRGSSVSDVNMEQVFGVISAKDKEVSTGVEIDTSEADELLRQSKETEEAQKQAAEQARLAREEQERKEREEAEAKKAEAAAQPEPEPTVEPEPAPAAEPTQPAPKRDRITIDLAAASSTATPEPTVGHAPTEEQRSRMKRRFSNLKSSTYASVEDYMVGNNLITAKQKMELLNELSKCHREGKAVRFYDLVLQHNLCEPEDMVQIIAKVNRMEILGWKQVESLTPIFDEFQLEHCKKLKFFRAPDDSQGNVRIVCSLSASSIDSSIRRLFDTPRILYTLDQYIVEKLNSIV